MRFKANKIYPVQTLDEISVYELRPSHPGSSDHIEERLHFRPDEVSTSTIYKITKLDGTTPIYPSNVNRATSTHGLLVLSSEKQMK